MPSQITRLTLASLTLILVLVLQVSAVLGASPSPDFSISVSPSSLTIPVTSSGLVQITLTSLNSFSSKVNLTASSSPTSDPTLILGASNLTLPARGTANTWLNITIQSSVDYAVTVVGTSGVLTHSATVNVAWGSPHTDFIVTTNRAQLITPRSLADADQITVTSLHLFAGTINMAGTVNPVIANAPTVSYSPTSFTVSNWGSATTTLTVQTTATTPLQNYTITLSATGQTYAGPTTHSITLNLSVVNSGFEISANPSTFNTGTTDTDGTIIRVASVNGFAGNVTLSASVNPKAPGVYIPVTVRMFPNNLTLSPNGVQDSLLIATVSGSVADSYDITVVVNDGPLVRSLVLTFWVNTVQYRGYRTLNFLSATTGTTENLLINLTNQTSYLGPVTLHATVSPSVPNGPVISFQPSSLSLTSIGWNTTKMVVTTQSNTPLGVYIVVLSESSGTINLNPIAVILTLEVPVQFDMTVSPASFVLVAGNGIANAQLSITNLDKNPGQVAVSTSYNPTAFTVVLWRNPSLYYIENDPLDITNGSTAVLSIVVQANPSARAGNYTVTIAGASGSIIQATTIRVEVVSLSSSFLECQVFRAGIPYPSSTINLDYNFTDIGQLSMTVLEVQLQAFSRTSLPISTHVTLTGGQSKIITTTLEIPGTARLGPQILSFYVQWEFYNPSNSQWEIANPLVFNGNLTILAPPAPQPPTPSTPHSTGPSSGITNLAQTLQDLVSQLAGGQSTMPLFNGSLDEATVLVIAVAIYWGLLLLAILLLVKQRNRIRTPKDFERTNTWTAGLRNNSGVLAILYLVYYYVWTLIPK